MPIDNTAPQKRLSSKQIAKKKRLRVPIPIGNRIMYTALDSHDLIRMCHISKAQAYRWINGTNEIPAGYMDLIKIKAIGMLPDREWLGWNIKEGRLYSPNGRHFVPEELEQVQYIRDQNHFSERRIQELKQQITDTHKSLMDYCAGQRKLTELEAIGKPEQLTHNTTHLPQYS